MTQVSSIVVLLVGFSSLVSVQSLVAYDCRQGTCPQGNCGIDGICTDCPAGFTGPDCSGPTDAEKAACTDPTLCQNSGECFNKDGTDQCYCTATAGAFTGAICDMPRDELKCSTAGFEITFTTYFGDNFDTKGAMYVSTKKDTTECTFNSGQSKTISFSGTCGDYPEVTAQVNGADETSRSMNIYVIYDKDKISHTDLLVTAKCINAGGNTFESSVELIQVNAADIEGNLQKTATSGTFNPSLGIGIAALKLDGSPITSADTFPLGQKINMEFKLTVADYPFFRITYMEVSDNTDGGSVTKLIENGCVAKDGEAIIADITYNAADPDTEKTTIISVYVFKYFTSATLKFSAKVTVYQTTQEAERKTCNADVFAYTNDVTHQVGYGTTSDTPVIAPQRRRRAADEGNDQSSVQGTMEVAINVRDLGENVKAIKGLLDTQTKQESCLKNIVFLLPLILMSVLLVISMGMTLFFCLKFTRRNLTDNPGLGSAVNMGYKA